jgi:HAD superfamily hydrolase (TIGR01549 family)
MIKVLVCDGDGTLQIPNPSDRIRELVDSLPAMGVHLAVASNNPRQAILDSFDKAGLPHPSVVATPSTVGSHKPSPDFIEYISTSLDVAPNEIVYLGDDDETDIFCAINAGVLPICAHYSTAPKSREYGLPFDRPGQVLRYLKRFGNQEAPYFGWEFQKQGLAVGEPAEVYALVGNHSRWLTPTLKRVLKQHQNVGVTNTVTGREVYVRNVLLMHLVTQCYLSGVTLDADWFTVYPGHLASSENPTLDYFGKWIKDCFRDQFEKNLLVRHADAQKSQHAGSDRNIYEQFKTIHVNPEYKGKIEGKTVAVMDDFTTEGYSLETARRMLLEAGAEKVIGLAIAKYGKRGAFTRIEESWDPFSRCSLSEEDILVGAGYGDFNKKVDTHFRDEVWSMYSFP